MIMFYVNMSRKSFKKKESVKALKHIQELFKIALENPGSEISKNSIKLMINYSKKFRQTIPRSIKRSYCKYCYSVYVPGKNCSIRFRKGENTIKVITCKSCGKIKRIVMS